jgi:hypothetical protein
LAKAQFHRHQRVWVEAVGAWATIDRLIPVWSKGFDEPVRITYDVGLGREFTANELKADAPTEGALNGAGGACAPATNGRSLKTAATIRCPAPFRWWSPIQRIGAAGASPAPNTIAHPTRSNIKPG